VVRPTIATPILFISAAGASESVAPVLTEKFDSYVPFVEDRLRSRTVTRVNPISNLRMAALNDREEDNSLGELNNHRKVVEKIRS